MSGFKIGDLFTVDPTLFPTQCHGVVYRVESLPKGAKGVNYKGVPADGGGRGVRAPEYAMRRYEGPTDPKITNTTSMIVPSPPVGALVRVKDDAPSVHLERGGLYVVLGDARNSFTAVRLARLGGDHGRYFPKIPVAWLDVVDPSHVKVA